MRLDRAVSERDSHVGALLVVVVAAHCISECFERWIMFEQYFL